MLRVDRRLKFTLHDIAESCAIDIKLGLVEELGDTTISERSIWEIIGIAGDDIE
jgi:hypothetical protein